MKTEVDYIISTFKSKFGAYQSKKGTKGILKLYISSIWSISNNNFEEFLLQLNFFMTVERYCLERAFNKVRIKGGACNPCCVHNISHKTIEYLFNGDSE